MRAMILAAGRGERLRPLTDFTPKPLLPVAAKPLIEYHIERLAAAGYEQIVVNTHYLAEQIHLAIGNGERFGLEVIFSKEYPEVLETGGGIFKALPFLGDQPFCVINGDVFCDHDLTFPKMMASTLAHLILVPNPDHHLEGDFSLEDGRLKNGNGGRYTFSGIGWYHPELFEDCRPGRFPLAPVLRQAIDTGQISGEVYDGMWIDVGTVERLKQVNEILKKKGREV